MPTAVKPQTYANHRAFTPWYLLAGLVLAADVVVRIVQAVRDPGPATIWALPVGAALVVVWGVSRGKAQRMQDRIIRLEMRLRLERVLPPQQHADIARLSLGQLVALRFASDAELPALVKDVVANGVEDREEIKRRVKEWQPDWLRV
jgi:hypothetical protein